MKVQELREKNLGELNKELDSLLREQFNLRMQKGVDNNTVRPHAFKTVRRAIARVKTLIRQKADHNE